MKQLTRKPPSSERKETTRVGQARRNRLETHLKNSLWSCYGRLRNGPGFSYVSDVAETGTGAGVAVLEPAEAGFPQASGSYLNAGGASWRPGPRRYALPVTMPAASGAALTQRERGRGRPLRGDALPLSRWRESAIPADGSLWMDSPSLAVRWRRLSPLSLRPVWGLICQWLLILCLLIAVPQDSAAQPRRPDLELGRNVVMGLASDSPRSACSTCHGLHGASDSAGAFPRLAGQAQWYLYKQLKDYASGDRPNDVMGPIAKALTDAQMQAAAAYYGAQRAPAETPQRAVAPLTLQQGAAIAALGAPDKGVAACVNCHGPNNTGLPPSFPYLAGQAAPYMKLQLQLWKDGVRKNDPLGVMRHIAQQLSNEQIDALTLYLSSLKPPEGSLPQ